MNWIRQHRVRAALIGLIGVFLGVTAWFGMRSLVAFDTLTGEDFQPDEAAETVDTLTDDQTAKIREDLEEERERARTTSLPSSQSDDPDTEGGEWLDALEEMLEAEDYGTEVHPYAFAEPVPDDEYESILLVGSDASGRLADVIIDILLPADGSTPTLVSLPRDLYLPNACTRTWTRINANLAGCGEFASGPELLALAVGRYTGIPVDHYARITFDGFESLIDALGGVTVCTDVALRDTFSDLYLEAGCSEVDGETALAWVRSRKGQAFIDGAWRSAGVGDYGRQEKQQELLLQIAEELSSQRNLPALANTLEQLAPYVTLDDGWSAAKAASLAWTYRSLDVEDIERVQIPTEGHTTPSGAAVLLPTVPFESVLSGDYEALAG